MANWTNEPNPFGQNRTPLLLGLSSADGVTPVPVAVNPANGAIATSATLSAASIALNDGVTTSRKASVLSLTDSNPIATAIVDSNGDQITSFGGGTQYTEGNVPPAHPTGNVLIYKDDNLLVWNAVSSNFGLPIRLDGSTSSLPVDVLTISGVSWSMATPGTPKVGIADGVGNGLTSQTVTLAAGSSQILATGVMGVTPAVSTGSFTNATQSTAITASSLAGMQSIRVTVQGTYSTATATFQLSDDSGSTWNTVQGTRTDTGAIESGYTSITNTQRSWVIPITGATDFRVQSSAVTSGTIIVSITPSGLPTSTTASVQLGAGTNVIGHVITDTGSTTAVTQATAASLNATVVGTGTFVVQATLAAETTKVIGTVRTADGAGNLYTTNSTTYTAKFAQDANLLGTLGTAFSTAGKVDVKAADGDVFVRQTTAANLNATVVGTGTFATQATITDGGSVTLGAKADAKSTATDTTAVTIMQVLKEISFMEQTPASRAVTNAGTFAVQATLAAETTKVIGTVRTADGAGNLYTTNSSTFTAKFAQDTNLLGTLGTAFSTAGKVDIKGADGDVFVRNATAGNFLANVTLQTQTDTVMVGGVNIKEINAVAPLMGNGVTGTGSLRVTIASDNTVVPGVGAGATGAAVPANASYAGGIAKTSLPAAGSDGNLTGQMSDKFGRQVILNNAIRDIQGSQTTTISASTSETTIITAAASTFNDLVTLFISNTSATAARVDIRDTTGGSVIFQLYIPAGDMRGFSLATPWPQTTVNTNWTAQSSASVTDLRVSAMFIKNK